MPIRPTCHSQGHICSQPRARHTRHDIELGLAGFMLFLCTSVATAQEHSAGNPLRSLFHGIGSVLSSFISPALSRFTELIDKGEFDEASSFYELNKSALTERRDELPKALDRLAAGLNAARETPLQHMAAALVGYLDNDGRREDRWAAIRLDLRHANTLVEEYEKHSILKDAKYRISTLTEVRELSGKLKEVLSREAKIAFAKYDHLSPKTFSTAYPIDVGMQLNQDDRWSSQFDRLRTASTTQIETFWRANHAALTRAQIEEISALYMSRVFDALEAGGTFFDKWGALLQAKRSGFLPIQVPGFRVAAVQLSSIPESAIGQVLVNDDVQLGLRTVSTVEMPDVGSTSADYVLLVKVLPIEPRRKVATRSKESSRVQVGTESLPNPAYAAAQAKFIQVQSEYNAQRIQNAVTPSYSAAAAILRGVGEGLMAVAVNKAREELASTPATVEQPVYRSYNFDVSNVDVAKSLQVHVWVVDRAGRRGAKQTLTREDQRSFRIASGIQENDPDRYRHSAAFANEKELDAYEAEVPPLRLSWILEELERQQPSFVSLQSENSFLRESATLDAIASARLANVSHLPASAVVSDVRMDSVVVVKSLSGSLGSGFYVAPDLVITNYHVVEGSRMASVKLRNGLEAVGRVVKSDAGLDLALIKVTDGGPPVSFADFPISTGVTVDAIGHPTGLEFTVTRGIVSAVRSMRNPLVAGSREMQVVQTDAAISPGNSGGPLFVGGQVIGINSQKLVRRGVEGIGFAVHYREIQRFIAEN
jgi:serine protease Do